MATRSLFLAGSHVCALAPAEQAPAPQAPKDSNSDDKARLTSDYGPRPRVDHIAVGVSKLSPAASIGTKPAPRPRAGGLRGANAATARGHPRQPNPRPPASRRGAPRRPPRRASRRLLTRQVSVSDRGKLIGLPLSARPSDGDLAPALAVPRIPGRKAKAQPRIERKARGSRASARGSRASAKPPGPRAGGHVAPTKTRASRRLLTRQV